MVQRLHAALPAEQQALLLSARSAVCARPPQMRREQFAYMTLALCRQYAPNLEGPFKVYVFNLNPRV
jgi:hypothetical protein